MRIKVTRPDGDLVWEAERADGFLPNLSMFGVGTEGQLWVFPSLPDAIYPPWKMEIVPGMGEKRIAKKKGV